MYPLTKGCGNILIFSVSLGLGMREIQKIFYKNLQMVSLTYLWSMILRQRNQSIDSHRNIVGTLRLTGLKDLVAD